MKLGFVSAIVPEYTLEQVLSFAHKTGFSSVELMCWPPGKAERRYAGVTHVDAADLSMDAIEKIQDLLAIHQVVDLGPGLLSQPALGRPGRGRGRRQPPAQGHRRRRGPGRRPGQLLRRPRPVAVGRGELAAVPGDLAAAGGPRRGAGTCGSASRTARCSSRQDEWPGGKNLATTPGDLAADVRRHPQPSFGLNFDPSHLIWQQMDYLAPLDEFRDRIFHVHAKDARIDRGRARSARRALVSQALAHAQAPRAGRRPLGGLPRRPGRRRLRPATWPSRSRTGPSKARSRRDGFADHQPAIPAAVSSRAELRKARCIHGGVHS